MDPVTVTRVINDYHYAEQVAAASAFVPAFYSLIDLFVGVNDNTPLFWIVAIKPQLCFGPAGVVVTHNVYACHRGSTCTDVDALAARECICL